MDYKERREMAEEIEKYLLQKECPTCDGETTMVKVEVWPNTGDIQTKWRCLNCLGLFAEIMKPVD